MAFNPSFYNNPFYKSIDRGETPPPGQLPAEDPNQLGKRLYVLVPDGQGGVIYWHADSPEGQSAVNLRGAKVQEIDEATHGDIHGYQDTTPGAAAVAGLEPGSAPPSAPVGSPDNPAPAPAAPAPSPSPAIQSTVGEPGAPQPSLTPPPAGPSQTSVTDASRGGMLKPDGQPAVGRWMRVTPWDNNSDRLGVDLVREDSTTGRAILADPAAKEGQQYQFVDTDWKHATTGAPLPEELTGSGKFQAIARMPGMTKNIVAFDGDAPIVDANGQPGKGYKVTFRLANGAEQTVTFARSTAGGNESFQISGVPEVNLTGVTSANKAELEVAQANYQRAMAAKAEADSTGVGIDNATKALELAEKERNNQLYGRPVSTKDLEQSGLTIAQTRGQEAATAAALQGIQNQNYQQVLQYFRDKTGDEAKALELTMQYFNNRANVDQNNNNTALRAGEAMVNADSASKTQRVSLANNRLSQSNQGYTEDLKTSADLNQYIDPGSDLGFKGFMAMQALRYANAQKYGAFDVNDKDLQFDPEKLPTSIRAFANPSAPSFATYPDLPSMRDEAETTAIRLGGRERPSPPGIKDGATPIQTAAPGPQPRIGNGQTAAPAASSPGFTGYTPPASAQPVTNTPVTTELPVQATGPNPTINPVTGEPTGLNPLPEGARGPDPAINPVTGEPTGVGATPQQPTEPGTPVPESEWVGGRVLPGVSAAPQANAERPDDVLTFVKRDEAGNVIGTARMVRAQYDAQKESGYAENPEWSLVNAEPGSIYTINPDGNPVPRVVEPTSDAAQSKLLPESEPTRPADARFGQYGASAGRAPEQAQESPSPAAVRDLLGFDRQRQPSGVYDNVPRDFSQLTPARIEPFSSAPSSAAEAQRTLVDEPARLAEEERRRRQREALFAQSRPQAIYGLFDGAYSF